MIQVRQWFVSGFCDRVTFTYKELRPEVPICLAPLATIRMMGFDLFDRIIVLVAPEAEANDCWTILPLPPERLDFRTEEGERC